jgi:opacity protein-like surface antigen
MKQMLRMTTAATAALLAMAVVPAQAGDDKFQRVEFFGAYTRIDPEGRNNDADGIGGGLRVVGGRRVGLFGDLQGEFVQTEFDAGGTDLDFGNYRAGIGWGFPAFGQLGFFQVKAEYVSLRFKQDGFGSDNQNGWGAQVQFEQDLAYSFGIHASLGYLDVDDADGTEYVIGFHWVPDVFGFFAQFRWLDLDFDNGGSQADISTVRAGFRVPF